MHTRITAFVIVAALAMSCGDDSPTPTAPTPTPTPTTTPTPTPVTLTDLSMVGPSAFVDNPIVPIGESVQLHMDAEYSDGTTRRVTNDATWVSSNDHVATVRNGLITGQNRGGANVRASFEGRTVTSINFRVERGRHVTVSNVKADHVGITYTDVTGTVRNTGSVAFRDDWTVRARFYTDGGSLLAENEAYSFEIRALPVDAQQVFEITVQIREWGYYTLEFFDGAGNMIQCAGCQRFR